MSAARTRILLGDDADLLARVRPDELARAAFEVVLCGSVEEARSHAADRPPPQAALFPAKGAIDGIAAAKSLRSDCPELGVILLLPPDRAEDRDECLIAGADDVVIGPLDPPELARRIQAKNGGLFRAGPKATVALKVHLQAPGGRVLEVEASQVSREGLELTLPPGIKPPPGTLVRTVFTLYEGGTLTCWGRTTGLVAPPKLAVRFVGLTREELAALDYFVSFYAKAGDAQAAPALA